MKAISEKYEEIKTFGIKKISIQAKKVKSSPKEFE